MINICKHMISEEIEVLKVEEKSFRTDIILGLPRKRSLKEALESLYPKLTANSCYPLVRRDERGLILHLFPRREESSRVYLNIGLAVITMITVFISGLALSRDQGLAWSPLAYLLGLLVPLLAHEIGHWSVMRYYGTPASLPYLIPAPPLQIGFLGTFGAVIDMKWLPPTSKALALTAIMGPLAGYIIALPFTVYGLNSSSIESYAPEGSPLLSFAPLSFTILISMVLEIPQGSVLLFSPLAFASYVVFLVTFLNLIPVAMLDGGHIIRSVGGGKAHEIISKVFIVTAILLTIFHPQLFLFAILILTLYFLSGGRHPGPSLGIERTSQAIIASSIVYGVLFVLTLPIPLV